MQYILRDIQQQVHLLLQVKSNGVLLASAIVATKKNPNAK